MLTALRNPKRAFFAALAVTIVLSLLPAQRMAWVNTAGDIIQIPLRPLEHGGRLLGLWLRPPHGEFDEYSTEARQRLELLTDELERTELLRLQEVRRVEELEEEIRQLQQVGEQVGVIPARPVIAWITGAGSNPTAQTVDIKSGEKEGVTPGTVAVFAGVHLIGRVGRVTTLGSDLVALTHPSSGPIKARVMSDSKPDVSPGKAQLVFLEPVGDGTFVGEAKADAGIAAGDVARLDDNYWPATAQMMVIGYVESIAEKPDQPLRMRVVVRPRYRLGDLRFVVLKIQREGSGR